MTALRTAPPPVVPGASPRGIETPKPRTLRPSLFNLFFGFFPASYDAGDPQIALEILYSRF